MKFKSLFILVISVLLLIIIAQNTQVVQFRVLFWSVQISRLIMLVLVFSTAFLLGYLTCLINQIRKKKRHPESPESSNP